MADLDFWQRLWQSNETPWDLGAAHPGLSLLLKLPSIISVLNNQSNFYVPGCGRAHEARFLAQLGYEVVAEDITAEAITIAKAIGQPDNLILRVGDALACPQDQQSTFDCIWDRAMLCALAPSDREAYQEACWQRLKPGGLFMAVLFTKGRPESPPPYGITLDDFMMAWQTRFSLTVGYQPRDDSSAAHIGDGKSLQEHYVVVRKR